MPRRLVTRAVSRTRARPERRHEGVRRAARDCGPRHGLGTRAAGRGRCGRSRVHLSAPICLRRNDESSALACHVGVCRAPTPVARPRTAIVKGIGNGAAPGGGLARTAARASLLRRFHLLVRRDHHEHGARADAASLVRQAGHGGVPGFRRTATVHRRRAVPFGPTDQCRGSQRGRGTPPPSS
jgi:hypothetical protein